MLTPTDTDTGLHMGLVRSEMRAVYMFILESEK